KTAATTSAASSKSDDNDDGQNADKGPDEDRTAAVGDAVLGKIKGKLNNAGDQTAGGTGSGSTVPLDGAAALSVALTEHTAEAAILEDTAVEADGDITVLSNVQHKGVRNYAISGAKAKGVKDGGTTAALSAGVAFALHKQNSRAWIGEGAGVTGQGVGVDARTDLPISDDWTDAFVAIYDDSKDIYDDLGLSFADV